VSGVVGGDSSSPKFLLLHNTPVLLGVTHKAGGAGGAFVTHYKDKINKVMKSLLADPEYVVEEFDLSEFQVLPSNSLFSRKGEP